MTGVDTLSNCRLIKQLKTYTSANRLILTGTPLHVCVLLNLQRSKILVAVVVSQNNLAELWSLLNFILPNIFDNLESFQKWCVLMV
jgi:ATP-dependent DNA helicase